IYCMSSVCIPIAKRILAVALRLSLEAGGAWAQMGYKVLPRSGFRGASNHAAVRTDSPLSGLNTDPTLAVETSEAAAEGATFALPENLPKTETLQALHAEQPIKRDAIIAPSEQTAAEMLRQNAGSSAMGERSLEEGD